MKKTITLLSVCLTVLVLSGSVLAGETDQAVTNYSVWIGSHYTEFTDNAKKIGEYNLGNTEMLPEVGLDLMSRSKGKLLSFSSYYFDDQNMRAILHAVSGDRLSFELSYRSMVIQNGQDLLTNIAAKEAAAAKMLTHDITDPGADYNYTRQEILSKVSLLLSEKGKVRFVAAHRSILKNGTEQAIASTHCFSCHLTSETVAVDKRTHTVEAGLEAEVSNFDVGYTVGYRLFESGMADPEARWDEAVHPWNIDAEPYLSEFPTRLVYSDTTQPYAALPRTEKISHKVRLKGKVGKGRLASSFGYSKATNDRTDLSTDALSGALSYAVPLSPKSRLIAKASMVRLTADDIFIDLPTFREGRPGWTEDFDHTRYSSLDRSVAKVSAEFISRITPKMTLSILAGYDRVDRDDYPVPDEGWTTSTLRGQAKLRYRKGLKYSTSLKYRFEKTTDPFMSGRGFFEDVGRDLLTPAGGGSTIFYHQREEIRYQNITTEPTVAHKVEWSSSWRPTSKVNVNFGVKGSYDKNNDLDSLDVNHLSVQPNLFLNLIPNSRTVVTAGFTLSHQKSRGPITVALFDG
ncbi:MAG: hypothetical protein KOO62_01510 [candidate division Zixibacteria bacterium]|nr:hypothetical protein [candidate division Zixibacteria bacterium]